MNLASTTISLGPFDLVAPIGQGGMGEVWQGTHRGQGVDVAVKVMTVRHSRERRFLDAFRHEVRSVARLAHPGIVRVFDYGVIPGQTALASQGQLVPESPYLIMELAIGTLEDIAVTELDWEQHRTILLGLLDALAHAHARGVIHRDIKPANVLLVPEESGPRLKLSDFGLARPREHDTGYDAAGPGKVTGTPRYMSPEQILGRWRDQGPWTDLYALGCVAYWLACGRPPFDGEDTEQILLGHLEGAVPDLAIDASVPAGYVNWLHGLLAREPRRRYRHAADAAHALLELGRGATRRSNLRIAHRRRTSAVDEAPTLNPELDITDLVSDTVVLPHLYEGGEAPGAAMVPDGRGSGPPVPARWQADDRAGHEAMLIGVGLGLFGLRPIPMVGRHGERDQLWRGLIRVHELRRPQVAILQGAAGTGKSRLAEWITERAHEVGAATVLKATHHHAPMATNGVARMLANPLRLVGLGREEILERLQPLFEVGGAIGSDELHDLLALSEIFAACCDSNYDEDLARIRFTTPLDRYGPMERLLERLATERPLILWIEDVQWGSDALSFVHYLLGRRGAGLLPVYLMLTVREETLVECPIEAGQLHGLLANASVELLEVRPLDEAEHLELVEHLLGLDDELTGEVARRTAGNPLFAILLVADWVEREILEPTAGGYRLRQGAEAPLPDDIHHLLLRRIELLTAQTISEDGPAGPGLLCLELAAALGQEIDRKEWKALCRHRGIEPADELVEVMVANRLARLTPRGWNFYHGALREALERLAKESKRWVDHHRASAYVLQELYSASRLGVARRLAWHWLQARDYEAALGPLLQAAREYRQASRHAHAQALLDQREEALRRLCLSEDDERWAEGWILRALIFADLTEYDDSLANLDRAEGVAERLGSAELIAECAYVRAVMAKSFGLFDECIRLIEKAHTHYVALDHRLGIAKTHHLQGTLGYWIGNDEASQEHYEKARALFEEQRNGRGLALCLQGLGTVANRLGDFERAERLILEAIRGFEASGDREGVVNCLNSLGETYRHQGDLARAERYYERVLSATLRNDISHPAFFNLAMVRMFQGDFTGARTILEDVFARLLERPRQAMIAMAHAYLTPCCAAEGDWPAFDVHIEEARVYIEAQSIAHADLATVIELAGDLALKVGQWERGRVAMELAMGQWLTLDEGERVEALAERLEGRRQLGNVE
jgi:eukaryotic-like serine/threonine-protein kinase